MKLIISSLEAGRIKHTEVELPEKFLDLSIELATGPIFQIGAADDNEQVLEVREVTYRSFAIFPQAQNTLHIKAL